MSKHRWDYPKPVEVDYRKRLHDRVEAAKKMAGKAVGEFRTLYGNEVNARARRNDTRNDSQRSNVKAISKMIEGVRLDYFGQFTESKDQKLAQQTAERADKYNQDQAEEKAKTVLGVEAIPETVSRKAVREFTRKNVNLIKSIPVQFFDDLENEIIQSLEQGDRVETLAKKVEERAGVAESRATLIARDQLGSLNAQVTGERQQKLGITKYRWVSSNDARVRPSHDVFDGNVYTWAEGTAEGHPGEPIQCRCTADPIMEGLLRNDAIRRQQQSVPARRRFV